MNISRYFETYSVNEKPLNQCNSPFLYKSQQQESNRSKGTKNGSASDKQRDILKLKNEYHKYASGCE